MNPFPCFHEEEKLWQQGYSHVAGIDEVGRGPLAGPVVAAAVIFPPQHEATWLREIRDSKKLTPKKREWLASRINSEARAVGIGSVPPETIDAIGIVNATRMAMCMAVTNLGTFVDSLLIDAMVLPEFSLPQKSIIKGDSISLSIAAASIVAKVYRDQVMIEYDRIYPGYGFARHKGYPTAEHLDNLEQIGYSPIHRLTYAPVQRIWKSHG